MAFAAKRRFARSIQRDAVKIKSSSGIEYATYEDVSAGGLKLWLDHDVNIGNIFALEFTLRSVGGRNAEISVLGQVVRCITRPSGHEVGIQFLDLQDSVRKEILQHTKTEDGPF